MRKEKQLLLEAQRQAALEKEVCTPCCLFTCLVQGPGVLRLLASIMLPSGPDFEARK